jgi:hypothetical protein
MRIVKRAFLAELAIASYPALSLFAVLQFGKGGQPKAER